MLLERDTRSPENAFRGHGNELGGSPSTPSPESVNPRLSGMCVYAEQRHDYSFKEEGTQTAELVWSGKTI